MDIEQHLENAENTHSRKINNSNVDTLYPILYKIIAEGMITWLQERKNLSVDELIGELRVFSAKQY
jgi:hypothetical protein